MSETDEPNSNITRRQIFEDTLSGAQDPPLFPRFRSDPKPVYTHLPRTLQEFRDQEGQESREQRLWEVWKRLPTPDPYADVAPLTRLAMSIGDYASLTPKRALKLKRLYERELSLRCGDPHKSTTPTWEEFLSYAETKETELWTIFSELDLDGNGHLDAQELTLALSKVGVILGPSTLPDFIAFLTSSSHSRSINFREFRDFLLLLPRKPSAAEIYKYYEVMKTIGADGRDTAPVGAGVTTGERPITTEVKEEFVSPSPRVHHEEEKKEALKQKQDPINGMTGFKYLLAGGIAGALSRTSTAPFDRVKIFLITRPHDVGITLRLNSGGFGLRAITGAITRIYTEGGLLAFWVGNGLNVAKIMPESAIKFFSYEYSKRLFAKYWDKVDSTKDISGFSRFISGGIGGITSQLSIYPIETIKTVMMSTSGEKQTVLEATRQIKNLGGIRGFYRGLAIGLLGVFPYSAIDMSIFDALKLAHHRSSGNDEPDVLSFLAFGSISSAVGASSVYPLALVRTRLQASGSSGHPTQYAGSWDVVVKTLEKEGWRGFYRGLFPSLAKVVPAQSISYVVYEYSKGRLGV